MDQTGFPGRGFDYYELTTNILPGAFLLLGLVVLFPDLGKFAFLLPDSAGSAVLFIMLAYVAGHLLQGPGNLLEQAYWQIFFQGRPTDWPLTRRGSTTMFAEMTWVQENTPCVRRDTYSKEDLGRWREKIGQVRSHAVHAGYSKRLDVFNGSYILFRGLLAAEAIVIILCVILPNAAFYRHMRFLLVLAIITAATIYRMHHFAKKYAEELFIVAGLLASHAEKLDDPGDPGGCN